MAYSKVLIYHDGNDFVARVIKDNIAGVTHGEEGRVFKWVTVLPNPDVLGSQCLVGVDIELLAKTGIVLE